MPKVFITFIGATKYEKTQYYFGDDHNHISAPFYYVQAAIFEKVLLDWDKDDAVYVFTTKDAFAYNYKNRLINGLTKEVVPNDGLENELAYLKKIGKIGSYQHTEIPDGNNESEIWTIFQSIFAVIKNHDELYFDITNGFRSLPMLGMVLLDYAKVLLNITPKAVYYGNFEAGRAQKTPQDTFVKAPVINVTSFAHLQAWTTAAQTFFSSGNAKLLAELTQSSNPILADNLSNFTEAILTCRGKMLTHDLDVDSFKNLVSLGRSTVYEAQLKPILERVEQKLEKFNSQNTQNGFAAVEWCIQNGLVQQGYTFLQETTVSFVLESVYGKAHLFDYDYRDAAASALNGFSKRRDDRNPMQHETREMRKFVNRINGLRENYKKLTGSEGLRNDINHAGFKQPFASPEQLRNDLKDIYREIKNMLD